MAKMIGRASLYSNAHIDMTSADYNNYKKIQEEVTSHHSKDLVHINAGGTRFTTLLETIAQSKSSYFLNFIRVDRTTGKIVLLPQRFIRDESGAIFVNRDGHLFSYVLQFMRDGKNTVLPRDAMLLSQLKREADFFGMEAFRYLIQETIVDLEKEMLEKNNELIGIRNSVSQIANSVYYNGLSR